MSKRVFLPYNSDIPVKDLLFSNNNMKYWKAQRLQSGYIELHFDSAPRDEDRIVDPQVTVLEKEFWHMVPDTYRG